MAGELEALISIGERLELILEKIAENGSSGLGGGGDGTGSGGKGTGTPSSPVSRGTSGRGTGNITRFTNAAGFSGLASTKIGRASMSSGAGAGLAEAGGAAIQFALTTAAQQTNPFTGAAQKQLSALGGIVGGLAGDKVGEIGANIFGLTEGLRVEKDAISATNAIVHNLIDSGREVGSDEIKQIFQGQKERFAPQVAASKEIARISGEVALENPTTKMDEFMVVIDAVKEKLRELGDNIVPR